MIRLKYKCLLFMSLIMTCDLLCVGITIAEESSKAKPPPEIVIDAPPPTQSPVKQETGRAETVTIYKSKVLPGFRPCTTEDYRNQDRAPIACQDEEGARAISTRDGKAVSEGLIVKDDAVPQGNIYKLRFERFKKEKAK
jgi:hypothetical protein